MKRVTIKIERGVPLPSRPTGIYNSYPFRDMKIGDRIFVPDSEAGERIRSAASYFSLRNPEYRFTVRREGNGYRAWRIEP